MKKKHYHKGIMCQLGFHKFGRSEAKIVLGGKAGKLIARVCEKCGHKKDKGYFVADLVPYSSNKVSINKNNKEEKNKLNKHNVNGRAGEAGEDGVGGRNSGYFEFIDGYVVEKGVKRKITKEDRRKLEKDMGKSIKQLNSILDGLNGGFGSVLNNQNISDFRSFREISSGYGYCVCRSGGWNSKRSHCKACKRNIRT